MQIYFVLGKTDYTIQINSYNLMHVYLSKNWEAKIIESFCQFKVNDVKGWGCVEWQYRNIQGRNVFKKITS